VMTVDWDRFVASLGDTRERPFFTLLLSRQPSGPWAEAPVSEGDDLRRELQQATPKRRRLALLAFIRTQVRSVLGLESSADISEEKPLMEMGLDSLMAVELRNRLRTRLATQQSLPATLIFDYPTVAALTDHLLRQMFREETPAPLESSPDDRRDDLPGKGEGTNVLAWLEDLPDDEVDRLVALHMQQRG
jgi:aryl carrier-like protein